MAISEKQRQKKLQQKKRKRQQAAARAAHLGSPVPAKAASFARAPVHECLVPESLFEMGAGGVLFARRSMDGQIGMCVFLVDVYCLGVKNAMFGRFELREYEQRIKPSVLGQPGHAGVHAVEFACGRKLVEGAVDYAADLGFSPHADYRSTKEIFGDVDPNDCPTSFEYGMDGKPFYVRGPSETLSRAKRIVDQLEKRCGTGNYNVMVEAGDPSVF